MVVDPAFDPKPARAEGASPVASAESPLLCLTGPTAVGKSGIALALAEQSGGEIVSVDSMQVYRGLDLGTAKPGPEERRRVPHHLIDVVELSESFDAARFVTLARRALDDIRDRGRRPVLCGGTGLYFKALLEGLGHAPASDPKLRAELVQTPLAELLAELDRRDPATAATIHRQNPRRVIRAIEIIRLTGRPCSELRAGWTQDSGPPKEFPGVVFLGFARESSDLRARIHARVDQMFAAGLVDEARRLLDAGLDRNPTALQALGYRQVAEHLRGDRPLAETIALVKQKTRQFARRQMTWFRHQLPVRWVPLAADEPPQATVRRLREGGFSELQMPASENRVGHPSGGR